MPISTDPAAAEFPTSRLRTRAEAEAYVASVCFKHGPPRLLGVELEWTVHHRSDPGRALDVATLVSALGPHAPPSLAPESPHRDLPNGSVLTVEPGGQVEISSLPTTSLPGLLGAVEADAAYLRRRLAAADLVLGEHGLDPHRPPNRILRVPRYAAMEAAFDRIGINGRLMMCSTAGVQVCLDAGEPGRVAARWSALHALGPVMIAAFGNSPRMSGADTGWQSARTRVLLNTDPPRTLPGPTAGDPALGWARRMLDVSVLCQRRDGDDWSAPSGLSFAEWIRRGGPTREDLDYHLTTVFPPVRPRGYLEVRYLDAQPGTDWMLPAAALAALFADEAVVDEVAARAAPVAGSWMRAAEHGLRDPALARAAREILDLARELLSETARGPGLAERLADHLSRRLAAAERRAPGGVPR
ncbi:ergothioneine biosynthesis glutamate--cysteine ligase EgtA [Saccharopolyspora griseoalba]|uniref:Glutamate--cysteine ligase EgtA n=1 Tax=Saccharopolyspora griseoalba TaxID=1431848 RepID=A0ABW2LCG1_9PSEU